MKCRFDLRFAAVLALAGGATPALADDTGIAGIHAWKQVGSKTCFIDHTHEGSGTGHDQATALRSAVKSWESFTDLEYGSDWASYANSIGKTVSCSKYQSDISCQVSSTPCKGGVLIKREPKSKKKPRVSALQKPSK